MTVQIATFLLTVCATLTGLITEAVKKTFAVRSPNIVALVVSVTTGICVPLIYLGITGDVPTWQDACYIIAMAVLTWLCSTLGFDKISQAIGQIKKTSY